MILVDTSIWIDHGRRRDDQLADWLTEGLVLGHPFVQGELACGRMPRRAEVLALFNRLPPATMVSHREMLHFVERHRLMGRGLGWVDSPSVGFEHGQSGHARNARRTTGTGRPQSGRRGVSGTERRHDPEAS
jgi:hypothetical protein